MTPRQRTEPRISSLKVGGVWTFWAPKSDEYLVGAVLDTGETDILLAPLLADTDWAGDTDVALSKAVLGYEALGLIWLVGWVLLEQAAEPVGMLSEEQVGLLKAAYEVWTEGGRIPNPAGPAIMGEKDPRKDAQAARADDLRSYFEPWALLQSEDELGPVVKGRREELGIDLRTWSAELEVDARTWEAFERAEADPNATIPTKALRRALEAADLLVSLRMLELAGESVRRHFEAPEQGVAKARRRRGARRTARRDPKAAEEAAARYTEALAKELGLWR
jgi:hypothetical protein